MPARHNSSAGARAVIATVALVGLALSAGIVVLLWPEPSAYVAPTAPPPEPVPQAAPQAALPAAAPTPQPAGPAEPGVLDQLSTAVDTLREDRSAAIALFERSVERLAGDWTDMDRGRLLAINAVVIEFVYRASPWPEVAASAVEAIGRDLGWLIDDASASAADAVTRAAWSGGMLVRLTRERDLSAFALAPASAKLSKALSELTPAQSDDASAFADGVAAVLLAAPDRLAAQQQDDSTLRAWERLVDTARASMLEPVRLNETLTHALEQLAKFGPDPVQSKSAASAIAMLTAAIEWDGSDGRARERLIEWMDDERVSNAALWAMTSEIAQQGLSAPIDVTMTLAAAASPLARAELRDRYRAVWGLLPTGLQDALLNDWANAARRDLAARSAPESASRLAAAVRLSLLSAAGRRLFDGAIDEAVTLLTESERATADPPPGSGGPSLRSASGDGRWALRYLTVSNNSAERQRLIAELSPRGRIGTIDAEVLVADAVRGSPRDVRRAAADAVRRLADSPAIVNALLEEAPLMPATHANADLVARVTLTPRLGPRRADWRLRSRQALVSRLLELLARRGDWSATDRHAERLSDVYAVRTGAAWRAASDADEQAASSAPAPSPNVEAALLRASWERTARTAFPSPNAPVALDRILRAHGSRLVQADGPIQRFHAEQVAICDLMAFVIGAERTNAADACAAVLEQFATERAAATDVVEQVLAGERAMLALWMIRLLGAEQGGPA